MLKKTALFALSLSVLLLAGCNTGGGAPTSSVPAQEKPVVQLPDVIKIGSIGPLTGDGASYGQDVKAGIALYFAQHPTIAGKPVQVIYEDGKCNGQDAANAAQKLITVDKVQVVLGGVCSGETLAAAPIAEQNKVVMISPPSSSPKISTAGDYIFRNYPSDEQVGKTMVDDVLKNYKKVAVFSEQTDFAQAYRGVVTKYLKDAGYPAVVDEVFAVDNTDFRTLLSKVQNAGADALIMLGQTPVTDGFAVKQAKELGLKIQIYGPDTIAGDDFFNTAKDAAEGVKAVYVADDPSRAGYADVVAQLPKAQGATVFQLFGYDAGELAANAIEKVGYDATAIKDYFYKMPLFKGVAGDVKFDANGDNQTPAAVRVAKNGKFVPVTEETTAASTPATKEK